MNGLKTALLLGGLSALVLLAGSLFGRSGLLIALVLALAMNGYAYFRSDTIRSPWAWMADAVVAPPASIVSERRC